MRLARNSCTMPISVFATSTKPNSASWPAPNTRMTTNSVPRIALKRVNTLARTISPSVRLVRSSAAFTFPSRTRCATSAAPSPCGPVITAIDCTAASLTTETVLACRSVVAMAEYPARMGKRRRALRRRHRAAPPGARRRRRPPARALRTADATSRSTCASSPRCPAPTAAQLERLTNVDYEQSFALVAELGDDIVAVARYDRRGTRRSRGRVHRRRTTSRAAGSAP